MLRPHWCPPWVREVLLVVDAECVCRGAEDGDAEDYDEAGDDGLCQMKGRRVDLHFLYILYFDRPWNSFVWWRKYEGKDREVSTRSTSNERQRME
jgi:hypothetical protein